MSKYAKPPAISRNDFDLICKIARRARQLAANMGVDIDVTMTEMDLENIHASCGLQLEALLAAPDGDFAHDVFGIRQHIDRDAGVLIDCFLPRYAV